MSQDRLAFLNERMNDPHMRQRFKNAQERRRECEAEWEAKHGSLDEQEVTEPTPEPEPEVTAPQEDTTDDEADPGADDEGVEDEETTGD
jgi:hypothetical protein